MGMTKKDKIRFEKLWKNLGELQKQENNIIAELCKDVTLNTDVKRVSVSLSSLEYRIRRLENLVYFIILALGGEGFATPELKETMRRCGLYELFEEGIK